MAIRKLNKRQRIELLAKIPMAVTFYKQLKDGTVVLVIQNNDLPDDLCGDNDRTYYPHERARDQRLDCSTGRLVAA